MRYYDPAKVAELFPKEDWFKARASSENGAGCVQVNIARSSEDLIGVSDTKNPGYAMVFDRREWASFLDGAKNGEFDI